MSSIDSWWVYLTIPVILVSLLVLIKLRQERTGKRMAYQSAEVGKEEAQLLEKETAVESLVEAGETEAKPEVSEETKPQDCPNYLGYLYMRKGSERAYIPSECYNCPKLLKCLYSPNVIEKVYGE